MYITQALHRDLQCRPDHTATVFGSRRYTFSQTVDIVARLAGGLRERGVQDDERVGLLALNSDRFHQAFLATAWANAVVVPINTRWSVEEIAYALTDASVRVLFVDDSFREMAEELRIRCPGLDHLVLCDPEESNPTTTALEVLPSIESIVAAASPIPDAHRKGELLAGIFYTGGTTGTPKGVMLSHRNLYVSSAAMAHAAPFPSDGVILHSAPLFHLGGLSSWIAAGQVGMTQVSVPVFDPLHVLRSVVEHQITHLMLVPTMIQLLLDHPDADAFDLSSIEQILYGASPMSESLLDKIAAAMPNARLVQAYGMTELSPTATILTDADHRDPQLRISVGRAAVHALVKVVDADGIEVPRGTFGEIVVAGDHVMIGYWNKSAETAAAVRDGWMHTGDGGHMDRNGYLYLSDRIKDMIISGGENVYSVEVERVIANHPAVAQCAVIAVPDTRWGERVHAVVVPIPGETLTLNELALHCRESIGGFKVPRSLEIRSSMPMSGAGKILKRTLREESLASEH